MGVVGILGLILKFSFLYFYLLKSNFKAPDSFGYLLLSNNFNQAYIYNLDHLAVESLFRTPGYPVFLSILPSIKSVILTQILLHFFLSLISILIFRKIHGSISPKLEFGLFLLIQIETSLVVYSFRILTDILFAFFVILFTYLLIKKLNKNTDLNVGISLPTILFCLLLVRPIGLILMAVFFILLLFSNYKTFYFKLMIVTIVIYSSYSAYNFFRLGVFTFSTVQNEHLLFYQGAAAKAISNSTTLISTQVEEELIRELNIGSSPSISVRNMYNGNRGVKLVLENKLSFLKLNSTGVIKNLYGPNRFEINQLFLDEGRVIKNQPIANIAVGLSFIITFLISTAGVFGIILLSRKTESNKFIAVLVSTLILFASGAGAYGRFRVPVAAFLSIYAILFLNYAIKRRDRDLP